MIYNVKQIQNLPIGNELLANIASLKQTTAVTRYIISIFGSGPLICSIFLMCFLCVLILI